MKAPDKIYIQQDMINNLILEKQEFDDDVAYIRKDALLEFAQEELSKASASSSSIGRRNAFIDIIDKLNSM